MVFSSQTHAKNRDTGIFRPATAAEEREARQAVEKYKAAAAKVEKLEAKEAFLLNREEELARDIRVIDNRMALREKEIQQRDKDMAQRDKDMAQRDKDMAQREKTIQQRANIIGNREGEIKDLEAQIAALEIGKQSAASSSSVSNAKPTGSSQPASTAQASSSTIPAQGPKRIALNAIAQMVLFDKQIPREKISESHRQQAREEVWPYLMQNDPKSGPITLSRDKRCAQLTPEGISSIVVPIIVQLKLKQCDFGGFKNEIALRNLLAAIKDQKYVEHLHFGGKLTDADANGLNTCLAEADLIELATETQKFIQSGRRFAITFDETSQNARFVELLGTLSAPAKKPLPAVPPKSSVNLPIAIPVSQAAVAYSTDGNNPPKLVPNRGSPPKGQA